MYILNFKVIEKLAATNDPAVMARLDVWLMQWYNSSDGLKQYLLQSLTEMVTKGLRNELLYE